MTQTKSPTVGNEDAPAVKRKAKVGGRTPQSEKKQPQKSSRRLRKVSAATLLWLAGLMLTLLAVAGSGYWLWLQLQTQVTSLTSEQADLREQLVATNNALSAATAQQQQSSAELQAALQRLESMMTETAQRLSATQNRSDERWQLEEALTLARLAAQRLQLDASARIALGLLQAADQVLAGLNPAAVLPLRRQMAADILALQSVTTVDLNGLYFQLEAIAEQLGQLNWQPTRVSQPEIDAEQSPWQAFWQSARQIVVISRLETPRQALPVQSDFEHWRQYSLLLIEQTQLALLARNQALFDAAIAQLADQLAQMASQFDFALLQQELTEVAAATLNPNWPDISPSVAIIEAFMARENADSASESVE